MIPTLDLLVEWHGDPEGGQRAVDALSPRASQDPTADGRYFVAGVEPTHALEWALDHLRWAFILQPVWLAEWIAQRLRLAARQYERQEGP